METYHLKNDLTIMCITAASFPEGIGAAYDKLKSITAYTDDNTLFGVSKPDTGVIVYKAGILTDDMYETSKLGLENFTLACGDYLTETVSDWFNNVPLISATFDKLLSDPRLDPEAWCVEWYKGYDVLCMVKIKQL